MMGGQNCHALLTFVDGVEWLARLRVATGTSPPHRVRDYIFRSEAATMEFLNRNRRVPVPAIYDWAYESDPENHVGFDYMLLQKLNGSALDFQKLPIAGKERVMQQLVDITIEICKHPFDEIGSIVRSKHDSAEFDIRAVAHFSAITRLINGHAGRLRHFRMKQPRQLMRT